MVVERIDVSEGDGINLDSLPKWLRDRIDYNNESAGRNTGRAHRFFNTDDSHDPDSQKKKDERAFNALLRALQDPAYARLYSEAVHSVDDAGRAAERALSKLAGEHEVAQERVQSMRDNAAVLPDGRRVFRAADGRLIADDGKDVSDQRSSIKGLSDTTPGWEEYLRAKETLEELERRQREIEDYERRVLEPYRQRLGDKDHPPKKEELEEIIRKTREAMPERVRAEMEPRLAGNSSSPDAVKPAANAYVEAADLGAPEMNAHFKAASSVPFEDPFASPQPLPAPKTV